MITSHQIFLISPERGWMPLSGNTTKILVWIYRSNTRFFQTWVFDVSVFSTFAEGNFQKLMKSLEFILSAYSCRWRIIVLHLLMWHIYITWKPEKLYDFKVDRTPFWCLVIVPSTVCMLSFMRRCPYATFASMCLSIGCSIIWSRWKCHE